MHTPPKTKRTTNALFTQARVRGLQSIMRSGSENHTVMQMSLNKLNQLRWEKERLTRERRNWEERIRIIDESLQEIYQNENTLKEKLTESCRNAALTTKSQRKRKRSRQSEPQENQSVVIRY